MQTHGVFLRLEGRRCVVVGGDSLAAAKALACVAAGAQVTLVAEVLLDDDAQDAIRSGRLHHVARSYQEGDLAGAVLAYASTREPELVARLRDEATAEGVLLNVIDVPAACDFFAGAVVERGPVRILVGTGGTAPAVASVVRARIEDTVGAEYGSLAIVTEAVRASLTDRADRTDLLRRLARSRLVDHLRGGDVVGAERLIREITGVRCSLVALGLGRGAS